MDAVLHRIEALPGSGRYAVTFRRPDGSEQTAVVHVPAPADGRGTEDPAGVDVAEASLPAGWTRNADPFRAVATALVAVDAARRVTPAAARLSDVEGGWDVSLGNVVLGADGTPTCTADGPMTQDAGRWVCGGCGALAVLA